MKEFLILLSLTIILVFIAFAGMAIKSFFNKTPSLRGCSSDLNGGSCGCVTEESCSN